jgi:hypothetical protein
MATYFCITIAMDPEAKPTSFLAYPFMVAICLLGGYLFGKAVWRANQRFAKLDRAPASASEIRNPDPPR